MPYSSDVEEQLAQRQEEEERRRAELEEIAQLERMAAMQEQDDGSNQGSQAVQQARQIAAQKAKQMAMQAGKKAVAAGGRAVAAGAASALAWIGTFLAATFPIWGTILLCLFVLVTLVSICNSSVTEGVQIAALKLAVAAIPGDICGQLAFNPSQTVIVPPNEAPPPGGGLTDAQARAFLASANICNYPLGFSRVDCVNASEPQTSLRGVQQATLNEILRFKLSCDLWARNAGLGVCEVVVSGGTEASGGHAGGPCSHLSGHKIDIRPTNLINQYIRTTFTSSGSRDGDPQFKNPATNVFYVDEGNHWDIGGVGCA